MQELFYKLLSDKVVLPALLVIGGVIFVVKRLVVSSVEKNATLRLIKKLKISPAYARSIADDLDTPYAGREGFPLAYYQKLKEYVAAPAMLGNYQILYTTDVSSSEFLVFTLISFDDFDVGITGKGTDVRKNSYLTFLIRHNPDEERMTIYSDTYNTSMEKFQRTGFLNAILTGAGA